MLEETASKIAFHGASKFAVARPGGFKFRQQLLNRPAARKGEPLPVRVASAFMQSGSTAVGNQYRTMAVKPLCYGFPGL